MDRDAPRDGGVRAIIVVILAVALLGLPVRPVLADGTGWTAASPPEDNAWFSVAYGDGVWVAVSFDGVNRVMRSTDGGVTWSPVAGGAASSWQGVAYGDGVWVAVANSGVNTMRSTDGGVTWSPVAVPVAVAANRWNSVAYGDGVWVAVADPSNYADPPTLVMRSTDGGVTWSAVNATGTYDWASVAYGDGAWIAVAIGTNSASPDRVMRSTDGGVTWSAVNATEPNAWISVAYGDGVWVAVAISGDNRVMRSTDGGETWSSVVAPEANAFPWSSVAYGDGVWVGVPYGGNRVMRSTDAGVSWASVAAADTTTYWGTSIAFGDGVWVSVANDGWNLLIVSRTVIAPGPSEVLPPSLTCAPATPIAGGRTTCEVIGGDPGIDILWRAAYNPVIAEAGVTLGADGTGTFAFTIPTAAVGQELTVELVDWTPPLSLGAVGGPVPDVVPAGDGPSHPAGRRALVFALFAFVVTVALRGASRTTV